MAEIKAAIAKNRDKQIDKRLTVLELVGEGMERAEIARITGFSVSYVPKLAAAYRKSGIGAIIDNHYHGNRRSLTIVEPLNGDNFFLVLPYCNTNCMNLFLKRLSEEYPNDVILLCCDGAAWHKAGTLSVPANIELFFIPPYTPEMNPIEQIWKEVRQVGFRNEIFASLKKVVDRLCETIRGLSNAAVQSITGRQWIVRCFN